MKPYRSREYLDLAYACNSHCMKCGATPCEPAHYSGLMADKLGKGGAQKVADLVCAHLCRKCHVEFDNYAKGNDDARAVDFLILCWRTLLALVDAGQVSVVVNEFPVDRNWHEPKASAGWMAGKTRKRSTARPDKVIQRGGT
jgi:hypothetical protein